MLLEVSGYTHPYVLPHNIVPYITKWEKNINIHSVTIGTKLI